MIKSAFVDAELWQAALLKPANPFINYLDAVSARDGVEWHIEQNPYSDRPVRFFIGDCEMFTEHDQLVSLDHYGFESCLVFESICRAYENWKRAQ